MVEFREIEGGGVASALGFKAGGIHAGFRRDPQRLDLALVVADEVCAAAGTFTRNVFCAAPVTVSKQHLGSDNAGTARAIVINSGTANAATGDTGVATAQRSAEIVADAVTCSADDVLVASTGVIGQHLPLEPFEQNVPVLADEVTRCGGHDAANAIMTTDTVSKEYALSYISESEDFAGTKITVGGMAKGSGMIMPDMATMIACITTDAPVASADLHDALLGAVRSSFNKVTVDSDTSTNDTCFLLASGKAAITAGKVIRPGSTAAEEFAAALTQVCGTLARKMAVDGEGATKLITVRVSGAATDGDADAAARAVANSPLVKTAVFGHDANWGRVAMALGKSGAAFRQEDCDIDMLGIPVLRDGLPVPVDEDDALRRFEADEIVIEADLGAGDCSTTIWTCDFSHDYISINGDYRS